MPVWREFRLWYSSAYTSAPSPDALFDFKKRRLLPALEHYNVEYFFILDEPQFILVRMQLENDEVTEIRTSLEQLLHETNTPFSKVSLESWSPSEDARTRILNARRMVEQQISFQGIPEGGWRVRREANGNWVAEPENLDQKTEAFANFMAHVAGEFTRVYLKEMPYRVNDRWLMSLFIHLLMDSISTWQNEESDVRLFPYV